MTRLKGVRKQFRSIRLLFNKKETALYRWLLAIIILSSLVEMIGLGAISPLISLAVEGDETSSAVIQLLSRLTGLSGKGLLLFAGLGFIGLTIGKNVFSLYVFAETSRFATRIYRSLSARLMGNYLLHDYIWFMDKNSSDFPRLIIQEVNRVTRSVIYNVILIISNLVLVLGLTLLLALENWLIALTMALFLGGLYTGLFVFFKGRLKFLGKRRFRLDEQRFRLINNAFAGIKEVKVRDGEDFFLGLYRKIAFQQSRVTVRSDVYAVAPRYAVETIIFVMAGAGILFLGLSERNLSDILPTLSLFGMVGYKLLPTMQKISRSVNTVVANLESFRKLRKDLVLGTPDSAKGDCKKLSLKENLDLNDVTFSYMVNNQPVLKGINLSIKSNEKLGVVGFSGSGKTTLLNLLMGLLEPNTGVLTVDGTMLSHENLPCWRKNIGLVSQDVYLLDGTIKENIAYGRDISQIEQSKLIASAKAAEIHETISELPEGYDTEVGERGMRLSGGQAQRIVIARALYNDPDVLIFDEATSAMDNLTEKAIMDSIDRLSGQKTLIIVAHRLSTVKDCDRIILLKDGQIVSQGRYEELLESNEQFRTLAMETQN